MRIKIIIIIVVAILLIAITAVALFGGSSEKKEYLVRTPGLPQDQLPRAINTKGIGDDLQLVVNNFDGYSIEVPAEWDVENQASKTGGAKISYDPDAVETEDEIGHFLGGLLMDIDTFDNPDQLNIPNWLRLSDEGISFFPDDNFQPFDHSLGAAYKTPRKNIFEEGVLEEDTSFTKYLFEGNGKIYTITCLALGEGFETFISLCENQVPSFRTLPKDPLAQYIPFSSERFDVSRTGANPTTGNAEYRVALRPNSNVGDKDFEKEIDDLVERVNSWISSKGVDPKNLSIEWVTE